MLNVIVTGASRGLGLAISTALAAKGYRVLAIARTPSEALQRACPSGDAAAPGRIVFKGFDLQNTQALGSFVSSLRKEFGPIFGLINNAGVGTSGLLSMMRDDQIETLTRLNTLSPLILTKYVVRSMMVERSGRIVNISSVVASTGYNGLAAYAATKAALIGFTRSLAREVGPLGITVNAIAPGFIATDMTREMDQSAFERIIRRSALKRLPVAEDVAGAVDY